MSHFQKRINKRVRENLIIGDVMSNDYKSTLDYIKENLGEQKGVAVKEILLGSGEGISATVIYMRGIVDKDTIDRSVLSPLMLQINEKLVRDDRVAKYLCKKYITTNTTIENDLDKVISEIKIGNTALVLEDVEKYIVIGTAGGEHRSISDPVAEYSVRGPRDTFVENLETNISLITRRIKDKSLVVERMQIGKRSETDVAIIYINDIMNEEILLNIKTKLKMIDVDFIMMAGSIEQSLENNTYTVFPQSYTTERPDVVEANLMEGRFAIIISGTPRVITVPSVFFEFFQGVEDYYQRTVVANVGRMLRYFATVITIILPSLYLTLIKFNAELIPIKFIVPIVSSRTDIALPPLFEILTIEIIIELLREGGMRLPSKIAQTLSIVGGIIIGEAAREARIVSAATLLIVGVTVVSTFLIVNYDMALAVRLLKFPALILANFMGVFGVSICCVFIIGNLYSLESFGVPYFSLNKKEVKDTLIRGPLYSMKNRPEDFKTKDKTRMRYFKSRGKNNG